MLAMRLDYSNKYRVLLTEVLPYEVPLLFSNYGFYSWINDKGNQIFDECFSGIHMTRPFDYQIRREGRKKSRKLSVIHPLNQLKIADFYDKYNTRLLYVCSSSPFSIRHIEKKASCVFVAEDVSTFQKETEERKLEVEENYVDKKFRSYFSYLKYDFIYKFFESGDYLRLEQKYEWMMTTDVANCFYNIYTHSVTWAVKDKETGKTQGFNKTIETFEKEFDQLMQNCNYRETNGIVVGPEVSRIFAEVIFQRIDRDVLEQFKTMGYKLGSDYEIRRYVDDCYVYSHSRKQLEEILDVLQEKLQAFHLYINPSKTVYYERPFCNNLSLAKNGVEQLISNYLEKFFEKKDDGSFLKAVADPVESWMRFAKQFRFLAKRYDVRYGEVNSYCLTLLGKKVKQAFDDGMKFDAKRASLIFYVSIYLFYLDMYASVSVKLCHIIYYVYKNSDTKAHQEIEILLRRELKRCFDIYQRDMIKDATNLEVMNLLLTVNRLMKMKFPQSFLLELFGLKLGNANTYERLDYFQICTLLSLFKKDGDYINAKKELESEIKDRLETKAALNKAENALLFMDIMQCPYLEKELKIEIIKKTCEIKNEAKVNARLNALTNKRKWFYDWSEDRDIVEFIEKKSYKHPYR